MNSVLVDFARAGLLLLMLMLSCLAIFFSWKTQEAVAVNQLTYLKEQYHHSVFECEYRLPRPFGDPHDHHKGNIAAVTFPKTIIIIWSVYAVVQASAMIVYAKAGLDVRFPARSVSSAPASANADDAAGTNKK